MTQELTLDSVMARRFELIEQQAVIAGRHKAEMEPINEELNLCEQFIKAEMLAGNMQQFKSSSTGHMAFFVTKDSVKVTDMGGVIHTILAAAPPPGNVAPEQWSLMLNHIQEHGLWGLLTNAVRKEAVRELVEAKAPPAGVDLVSFRDLNWRRGKN